jgi:5'(3')-deoxyribonucleotidase
VNYLHKAKVDIHILSAAPEWQLDGKKQKTAWINKHFDIKASNIHIFRRVEKQKYAKKGDILIDDYKRNIKEWEAAGGTGILHTKTMTTIAQLRELDIS